MTDTKSNFPYKTLIWGALALIAMFLFKGELKDLLSRADEVAIFGIELKVGKEQAKKLEMAIQGYKDKMVEFNQEITEQQEQIKKLEVLKSQLETDIANCPDAAENTRKLNTEFIKIFQTNKALKEKSEVLKDTKILQRMNTGSLVPVGN